MATFREEDAAAGKEIGKDVRLRQLVSKASGGKEKKAKPAPAKPIPEAAETDAGLLTADFELTEKLQLPECHSLGWVHAWVKADPKGLGKGWDGVLDEAKWGTPSPQQLVTRNWDWKITDAQWRD